VHASEDYRFCDAGGVDHSGVEIRANGKSLSEILGVSYAQERQDSDTTAERPQLHRKS